MLAGAFAGIAVGRLRSPQKPARAHNLTGALGDVPSRPSQGTRTPSREQQSFEGLILTGIDTHASRQSHTRGDIHRHWKRNSDDIKSGGIFVIMEGTVERNSRSRFVHTIRSTESARTGF